MDDDCIHSQCEKKRWILVGVGGVSVQCEMGVSQLPFQELDANFEATASSLIA